MRAVVQRVSSAAVTVVEQTAVPEPSQAGGPIIDAAVVAQVVGRIDRPGLVILIGATHGDTAETAAKMAAKIWRLRIMAEERSAADLQAPLLVVSQFTLYADTSRGRRPSWNRAAPRQASEPLVEAFIDALHALGAEVETGRFGAQMQVSLINDGPMTILLDSDQFT